MRGNSLYQFDLQLCGYVVGNVLEHFDNVEFADWVRTSVPEGLVKYLDDRLNKIDTIEMLLGDKELIALEMAMENPPLELDRYWRAYPQLHKRTLAMIREVRNSFCRQTAHDWAVRCKKYAKRLSASRLTLHDGIQIAHEWLQELRQFLHELNAVQLIPAPAGQCPTPMHRQLLQELGKSPCSTVPSDCDSLETVQIIFIEQMRKTIKELPAGNTAKSAVLIKKASIARQPGLLALRYLEKHGEYNGFSRPKSQRYAEVKRSKNKRFN